MPMTSGTESSANLHISLSYVSDTTSTTKDKLCKNIMNIEFHNRITYLLIHIKCSYMDLINFMNTTRNNIIHDCL